MPASSVSSEGRNGAPGLGDPMKRRDFIALLGGAAAAWPVRALAQQSKVPVIGYLSITGSPSIDPHRAAFRRGLSEAGHVEGRNAAIEFRTDDRLDRLPELAA